MSHFSFCVCVRRSENGVEVLHVWGETPEVPIRLPGGPNEDEFESSEGTTCRTFHDQTGLIPVGRKLVIRRPAGEAAFIYFWLVTEYSGELKRDKSISDRSGSVIGSPVGWSEAGWLLQILSPCHREGLCAALKRLAVDHADYAFAVADILRQAEFSLANPRT